MAEGRQIKKLDKEEYLGHNKVESPEPKAERRSASEIRTAMYGKDK